MALPITRTRVPLLSELCVESYLSSGRDHALTREQRRLLDELVLQYMWSNLKESVPKSTLGLQTIMSEIEESYASKNSASALESKVSHFYRKLAEVLASDFEEAGVILKNRVPCSSAEYAKLQKTLRKKWSDETLSILWTGLGRGGLRTLFERQNAFRRRVIPESPQEIRKWLKRSKNIPFLNQVEGISLNQLKIRACPAAVNRFQFLITLNLSRNNMRNFSCDLRPCQHLKELFLSHNEIHAFSPKLPKKLQCIDLSMNRLNSFSVNLKASSELKLLDISFNQIANFSSDLKDCKKLEKLNLSFNQINQFPFNLLHEKTRVQLSRNPLLQPITPQGFTRTKPHIVVEPPQPTPYIAGPVSFIRNPAQLMPPTSHLEPGE